MAPRRNDFARMQFGENCAAAIRKARSDAGMTQRALAEQAGLSHSMILAIEAGTTQCSLWAAAQIAEVLDTTIDALAPVTIEEREAS